ncbi:MAG: DMT family transporter [Proteobacteria bacterium]|nr:DMT family transporter [Pseudomonadota bacterium]
MHPPPRDNRRAIVVMLASVVFFGLMDGGLKALSARYPPFQVAALRGAASLPLVLAWALASGGWRALRPVRFSLHLLRGIIGVAMMGGFVYALKRMPLTDAYAISFVAPLLITAMSGPILGERVGPRRWAAIVVGFVGVLVALRPSGGGIVSVAGLAVLAAALGYAVSAITVRVLARTDSAQAIIVWLMLLLTFGAGVLAWLVGWVPVARADGWMIAEVGMAGTLGQYLITAAFLRGEASALAPLEYTALVWGVLLDYFVWHALPGAGTWVGAAIIVASGLYLLRHERVHAEAEHP